jgi:hypothetical protein
VQWSVVSCRSGREREGSAHGRDGLKAERDAVRDAVIRTCTCDGLNFLY